MSGNEWIVLANELMLYSGKVSTSTRKSFIKLVRQSNRALQQAMAIFGDSGIYEATERDINNFINLSIFGIEANFKDFQKERDSKSKSKSKRYEQKYEKYRK